jgi:hypothetical protein
MHKDKHKEKLDLNNIAKRLVTTQWVDDIKTIWQNGFTKLKLIQHNAMEGYVWTRAGYHELIR